jgi:hypothetical protein
MQGGFAPLLPVLALALCWATSGSAAAACADLTELQSLVDRAATALDKAQRTLAEPGSGSCKACYEKVVYCEQELEDLGISDGLGTGAQSPCGKIFRLLGDTASAPCRALVAECSWVKAQLAKKESDDARASLTAARVALAKCQVD